MMPPKWNALIVDDNATDRTIIRAILKNLGIRDIHEAENGAIAESKIDNAAEIKEPFNLIFIDWHMPSVNGLKLLKYIRDNRRDKSAKLIVMTGTADREAVENAMANGADDFIVKPVELDTLRKKIASLS